MARNALTLDEWNLLSGALDTAAKASQTRMHEIGDSANAEYKLEWARAEKLRMLKEKLHRMDLG